MSLTTTQILTLARKKVLEYEDDILDDATLLIYANLTQEDLKKKVFTNASIKTATVAFTSGVGTPPTDFGTLASDAYQSATNTAIPFPEISISDYARGDIYGITIEAGQFKVVPSSTASLYIRYYPTITTMTSSVDPSIDSYFHELIVYGIIYRALEDLQNEVNSKYYRDKYDYELTQKLNAQSNYEEGNQRGGQMFNGISIIDNGIDTSTTGFI